MRDDDHSHTLGGEGAHGAQHLARELRIERGGRLVKEHDVGPHGKRPCDGDALLLSAGELTRVVILAVHEADLGEELTRIGENLVPLHAFDMAGRFDEVLNDGHMREEVELLEDHARRHEDAPHVVGARVGRCCAAGIRPTEFLPADRNIAAVDGLELVDAAEQGRFP